MGGCYVGIGIAPSPTRTIADPGSDDHGRPVGSSAFITSRIETSSSASGASASPGLGDHADASTTKEIRPPRSAVIRHRPPQSAPGEVGSEQAQLDGELDVSISEALSPGQEKHQVAARKVGESAERPSSQLGNEPSRTAASGKDDAPGWRSPSD